MIHRIPAFNLVGPQTAGGWIFQPRAEAKETDILIYGQIGKSWFDDESVTEEKFRAELKKVPDEHTVRCLINSGGGNVHVGFGIYNMLKERKRVKCRVEGLAASIAAVIAMAGDEIEMPELSMMMIHKCWSGMDGNADVFRKFADELEKLDTMIANVFSAKCGKPVNTVLAKMADETWFSAKEAYAFGLCTKLDAKNQAVFLPMNLSRYKNVPGALVNLPATTRGAKTSEDTMKRKEILALLATVGMNINNEVTEDELRTHLQAAVMAGRIPQAKATELLTPETPAAPPAPPVAPPAPPVAPPAPPVAPNNLITAPEILASIKLLEAQLATEKRSRITNSVRQLVIDGCVPESQVDAWVARAVVDETILNNLRALRPAGVPPVGASGIQNLGNPVMEAYNLLGQDRSVQGVEKRIAFRTDRFKDLLNQRRQFNPQGANTLAAGLVNDYLSDALLVVFTNRLAMLSQFSSEWSADRIRPRASVDVKKATAGSTGQTNATNFESGDSTLAAITVTMNQYTQSFQMSNDDLQKGFRLKDISEINSLVFANTLSDVVTALMIAGNYGAATVIGAASAFDSADLPAIMALAKNYRQKILLLDGGHLAYLLPRDRQYFRLGEPGAYGFDAMLEQNRWTGATANAAGFICSKDAIGVASGLPVEMPAGEFMGISTVQLLNGISVQLCTWYSRATRTHWASYDIVFGAAVGDGGAAEVLVTA